MFGSPGEPGIMPLAVRQIFDHIMNTPQREFLLRVSYMEIYNEVIKDLLKPGNDNLKIHQHPSGEIFVGELEEHVIGSIDDVHRLINMGDGNRHIGETNMNEKSSRSHTIFRMAIESRSLHSATSSNIDGAVKISLLNLVDLAGSERVSSTGAEGIRLKEGGHINKSLLALGTVIAKLADEKDRSHIPYRDSKLTRILQSSLGGNARTGIVCTVTPASQHIDETLSTLRFANRAKNITNRPQVNEVISDDNLLKLYKREIEDLKRKLEESELRFSRVHLPNPLSISEHSTSTSPELQSSRELRTFPANDELHKAREKISSLEKEKDHIRRILDALKDQHEFACLERESYKVALESKKRQQHDVPQLPDPALRKKRKTDFDSFADTESYQLALNAIVTALRDINQERTTQAITELESRNIEKEIQMNSLNEKIYAIHSERNDLQSKMSQYQEECKYLREKCDSLEKERLELKEHRDKLLSEMTEELESVRLSVKILEDELRSANEKLESMDILSQKVVEAEKAQGSSEKIVESLKTHCSNLEIAKQDSERLLTERITCYQGDIAGLEKKLFSKEQELIEQKSLLENLKNTIEEDRKYRDLLSGETTATHQGLMAQAKQDLELKDSRLNELVLMLETLNGTLIEARSNMDKQGLHLTQLVQEKQTLQEKIVDLESSLLFTTGNLANKSKMLNYCLGRISQFLPSIPSIVAKLSLIEKKSYESAAVFHERWKNLELLSSQLAEQRENLNAVKKDLVEMREANSILLNDLNDSHNHQSAIELRSQELEQKLSENQAVMSSLSADLSAKNSMIISMERKLLDEVESLQAAQVKVFALEKEKMDQAAAIKSLQFDFEDKTNECESVTKKLLLLEKQLEDFQSSEIIPDHSKTIIEDLQEQIIRLKRQSENSIPHDLPPPQKFDALSKKVLGESNSDIKSVLYQKKQRANRLKQRNEETGDCKQQ